MSVRSLLLAVAILSAARAHADAVRYRCNGPATGPVRVITDDTHVCRGFTINKKQTLFSRLASGTLLTSRDGKTVVLIEDYLSGSVDTKRKIVETDIDSEVIENPTVLQIWHDGHRVAFFDIARLTKDVTKLEQSISHVRWVAELPPTVDGAQFTLVTTSGRKITFDAKKGTIVDETDVPTKRP